MAIAESGRYVRIAVIDTGRGIDEATLRQIFEPFFTTRLAGNGLGLATVREIVHGHGGTMNVRSKPGAGSCFEVWLPCIAPTASPSSKEFVAAAWRRRDGSWWSTRSANGLRAEELLAALGYEPVGCARARDALAACEEAPKQFDMVVSHLVPAASTLEFATALH